MIEWSKGAEEQLFEILLAQYGNQGDEALVK
jgi:hypothetical protein